MADLGGLVRDPAAQVIDRIERAEPEPVPDAEAKKRATIRKEFRELAAERSRAGTSGPAGNARPPAAPIEASSSALPSAISLSSAGSRA